jgi:DMSO/TMAO reductase YedYZ molybdopterin-dependent catalytic subunit
VPNAWHRLWSRVRALPWRRFAAGAIAGGSALFLTLILRLLGLGVFLPEVALDFVVGRIPGSLEAWFIGAMGEGAKALGLAVAIVVFLVVFGVYATFYRLVERRVPNRWAVLALYAVGTAAVALFVILPLIGGGFLGADTYQGAWAASFSLLLGGWLYAAVLDYFLVEVRAKHPEGFDISRRQFLKWSAAAAVIAVVAFYGLTAVGKRVARLAFASVSEMFAKEVTPNDEFYIVSKNVIDPTVDESTWRLVVDGLVTTPRTYTKADLLARTVVDEHVTLECVSNEVGGNLISTAKWSGVRLSDLLDESVVDPAADWILFTCADGYTVAIPLTRARDPATLLALRMNDRVLPVNHGLPARIVVPGLYGMFHAKWLTRITPVQGEVLGFWQQKGWTNQGLVRTTAIVATPRADSVVSGPTTIGGVAFAGDRGISRVEVSTDGGDSWATATLKAPPLSSLTWVLWTFPWTPPRGGSFRILARAVNRDEEPQTDTKASPFSDGATGYDAITLLVS